MQQKKRREFLKQHETPEQEKEIGAFLLCTLFPDRTYELNTSQPTFHSTLKLHYGHKEAEDRVFTSV